MEAPSADVLGIGGVDTGFTGLVLAELLDGDVSGEFDSLADLRSSLTLGSFVLNKSDLIRELLGSLLGLLKHFLFGVGLWSPSFGSSKSM